MLSGGSYSSIEMMVCFFFLFLFFFFQAEDGIRDYKVTGVQTCALPISCHVHQYILKFVIGKGNKYSCHSGLTL